MVTPGDYFNFDHNPLADVFQGLEFVWEVLDNIKPYLESAIRPNIGPLKARYGDFVPRTVVLFENDLFEDNFELQPGDTTKGKFEVLINGKEAPGAVVIYGGACFPDSQVELRPGVVVETGAMVKGPTIIGARTEVRQGAYVRGSCLIGQRCVVGHVSELKNAVFLDDAKAGHFAYCGDSVLGFGVNLGAGTKLANLKIRNTPIRLVAGMETYQVSRRKFGAIIGDNSELGCNTVTSPGTIMGPGTLTVPNTTVKSGIHKPKRLFR